jgi:hypothetical protein
MMEYGPIYDINSLLLLARNYLHGYQMCLSMKVKTQKLYRHIIKLWRAVDAHNGGMEARNGALEGLYTSGHRSHHFDEEQDPDLH